MEVHKRTPHEIFNMPQRLLVPLFQRPYVWSEENQWEPLWDDIVRVAERVLADPQSSHQPHFIGAVVLQQVPNSTGGFQERTIIDGQQRLTTLQVLLDAMNAEFEHAGAIKPAKRLERLIRNDEEFCNHMEDQYKVWPTNRDRDGFCEVMAAPTPVDYQSLKFKKERLPLAHKYFSEQIRIWLGNGSADSVIARADALEKTARELLQVVVIDLAADENAQEIFETLNARGAQLSAADLIKNFIFQRLLIEGADTESAYDMHWKQFETAFWEKEISIGKFRYPRAAVFLNHFLVARTGEVVKTQEVFSRFKVYALHESNVDMSELLRQIHAAANVYESFTRGADNLDSDITPLELFAYRMNVMETDSIKPLILFLLDPELPPIDDLELEAALNVLESFVVRRMVLSATTKNYNQLFTRLLSVLRQKGRDSVAKLISDFLSSQETDFAFWPDDDQLTRELLRTPIFRKKKRARMILEALEDHRRGFELHKRKVMGEQRVARGRLTVEHVLPQAWENHWKLQEGEDEEQLKASLHLLGNLTLLTTNLNSKVSNGPWLGESGKRKALAGQSTLMLNRDLTDDENRVWCVSAIQKRTAELTERFVRIWGAPAGHKVVLGQKSSDQRKNVSLSDLLSAGLLEAGTTIYPTWESLSDRFATVLSDGKIETDDGVIFRSPSGSGRHLTKTVSLGGWSFWAVGRGKDDARLIDLRDEYFNRFEINADEDEGLSDLDD
jgi:hypothetical protein